MCRKSWGRSIRIARHRGGGAGVSPDKKALREGSQVKEGDWNAKGKKGNELTRKAKDSKQKILRLQKECAS